MALDKDGDADAPADDLRSSIESAIETHEPEGGQSEEVTRPVETPDAQVAPEKAAKGDRNALGRFLPKAGGDPAQAQKPQEGLQSAPGTPPIAQPAAGQPAPVQAAPQAVAAPASWSPLAREAWKAVPAAAQAEIARREQEMARFVGESSAARNIAEQFTRTIQPYLGTIQQEGVDPLTAVRNLMQVTQTLRSGTQYEKAQTLARIVQVYGVDIQTLDAALVGAAPPEGQQANDPQYVQQAVQQALAPLYQAAQARQQQTIQQAEGEARSELEVFAQDPKNEFFQDLRHEMADIIELAEKHGRQVTLQQAYERAAMLHPEVSKVMLARQQGVNARSLTQAAQRARSAAVSVRGSAPVGNPNPQEPTSIRESIEAAIQAHS
jgi:hypothetical protein